MKFQKVLTYLVFDEFGNIYKEIRGDEIERNEQKLLTVRDKPGSGKLDTQQLSQQ